MKWAIGISIIYVVLCLGAFLLIPASSHGWLGVADDPLSGVFVLLLALPWTLLLSHMGDPGPVGAVAVIVAGIIINVAIVLAVGRWASRPKR